MAKKRKESPKTKSISDKIKTTPKSISTQKTIKIPQYTQQILTFLFLISLFLFSLYYRAIVPQEAVFRFDLVGIAIDDAIYHMRLVEHFINNFPDRIWYEVYTIYPYGQSIHFGPLWTYLIGVTCMFLGMTSTTEISTVGAYFPAIFGALMVFPTYFIAKNVFNRRIALLAAFLITVMPGQFLSRSILGFADHHIGEVFFSSLFIMFYIVAIKSSDNIRFSNVLNHKKYLTFTTLAGLSFSLYILQWCNGVFYGGIVALFILIVYIKNHAQSRPFEGFAITNIITFAVAFPLLIPFIDPANGFTAGRYSYLHALITIGASALFFALWKFSIYLSDKPKHYYPTAIALSALTFIIITKLFIPRLFVSFQKLVQIFQTRTGGGLTIAEAMPPTPGMIEGSYPTIFAFISTYNIAFMAFFVLAALIIFRYRQEQLLFLIWSLTIFALSLAQNRWFYYYSLNVAILSAFFGFIIIDYSGYKTLAKKFTPSTEFITENKETILITIGVSILVIYALFMPLYNVTSQSTEHGTVPSEFYQWHESMEWMRYNTPDPGVDYNGTFIRDPGIPFNHPNTSYGVMSWWDYGHIITCFAHRIPNANPLQAGIGGSPDNSPGASTFFTSQSEAQANAVLTNLGINNQPGARYIISTAYMAYSINNVMAVWNDDHEDYLTQVVISGNPTVIQGEKWFTNMESKLHIFDTNGLQHYRLVHESVPNPYARGGKDELKV